MFCKVLENDKQLCKDIVELITGRKVKEINYSIRQKDIQTRYNGKGIRLDVYFEDGETIYDLEMQAVMKRNLPKRTRFYQSSIDSVILDRGDDYDKLRDMIIIFICLEDPFEFGYSVYTFENRCVQNTDICLNDKVYKIFLNASGSRRGVPDKLNSFLDYLTTQTPKDDLTERIENSILRAKEQERWRKEYHMFASLAYLDAKADAREEGLAEGRAEGRAQGKLSELISLVEDGLLVPEIAARRLGITVQEFENKMKEKQPM